MGALGGVGVKKGNLEKPIRACELTPIEIEVLASVYFSSAHIGQFCWGDQTALKSMAPELAPPHVWFWRYPELEFGPHTNRSLENLLLEAATQRIYIQADMTSCRKDRPQVAFEADVARAVAECEKWRKARNKLKRDFIKPRAKAADILVGIGLLKSKKRSHEVMTANSKKYSKKGKPKAQETIFAVTRAGAMELQHLAREGKLPAVVQYRPRPQLDYPINSGREQGVEVIDNRLGLSTTAPTMREFNSASGGTGILQVRTPRRPDPSDKGVLEKEKMRELLAISAEEIDRKLKTARG
jgi:hypothetical protein